MELKVPDGIQPNTILRVRDQGVKLGSRQGDHLVKLNVRLPKKLTPRQKELVLELAKLGLE